MLHSQDLLLVIRVVRDVAELRHIRRVNLFVFPANEVKKIKKHAIINVSVIEDSTKTRLREGNIQYGWWPVCDS